jgi:hypothetical protein
MNTDVCGAVVEVNKHVLSELQNEILRTIFEPKSRRKGRRNCLKRSLVTSTLY